MLAAGYREYGASLTGRYGPRQDGTGLSLSVSPSWGSAAGAPHEVWHDDPPPIGGTGSGAALAAGIGYGVAMPGTGGVLTPFGEASLTAGGTRVRLGARFGLRSSGSAGSLDLEIAGERIDAPGAGPSHGATLSVNLLL